MSSYEDVDEIQIPVYLITGFLESGKSTFLAYTIAQEYFEFDGKTLLILCEEGEVEYNRATLKKHRTEVTVVAAEADLSAAALVLLQQQYRPDRVLLEYNGMWSVARLEAMKMPPGWGLVQQITTVDSSCFQPYMNNLKSMFVEMIRNTDLVIFNRCRAGDPLASYRRSVIVVNPKAQLLFENEAGQVEDIFDEAMPYDLAADIVDIPEEDYGIWYIDMRDNPEDYEGKKMRFKGRVLRSKEAQADFFVPGRLAMTCCADDTTFIGYLCKSSQARNLKTGSWVEVTAEVKWEYAKVYKDEGPVLYAVEIAPCPAPQEELVYFN